MLCCVVQNQFFQRGREFKNNFWSMFSLLQANWNNFDNVHYWPTSLFIPHPFKLNRTIIFSGNMENFDYVLLWSYFVLSSIPYYFSFLPIFSPFQAIWKHFDFFSFQQIWIFFSIMFFFDHILFCPPCIREGFNKTKH